MSKQRHIDTRFWSDSWVRKLNPLDRYFFLYLLTNDKCSYCGLYELPISIMAFESGIDERDIENTILPRLIPKVFYYKDWVFLANFKKYHVNRSPNSLKGYEAEILQVPQEIIKFFEKESRICISRSRSRSNSNSRSKRRIPSEGLQGASRGLGESAENKDEKQEFGEFGNVFLTKQEYEKLVEILNKDAVNGLIAELDGYIESTGKKYKSHYATIQNWARRKIREHITQTSTANKPKRQML